MISHPSRKRSRRRRRRLVLLRIFIPIAVIALIAGIFLVRRYMPSNETADLNEYFGITDASSESGDIAVVVDDEILSSKALSTNGTVYMDYDSVSDYLNDRFYWDANENILIYAGPSSVTKVDAGEDSYYVENTLNEEDYIIVKYLNGTAYVALDFVQQFTDMEYAMYEEPSRIVISTLTGEQTYTDAKSGAVVRLLGGIKSEILTTCEKGDLLRVIERLDNWTKVATTDGFIGYVSNKKISDEYTKTIDRGFEEPVYEHISKDFNINMTWDLITSAAANANISSTLSSASGINVISPTWFSISSSEGDITSLAGRDYVNSAHGAGVEVWGLVSNLDVDDSVTLNILSHTSLREHLESVILAAAIEYDLDGINIDFEISDTSIEDSYIEFIRELSILCSNNNLVLSADVPIADSNNYFYEYSELSNVCDYVVLMAYDEHYSGSGAGSVSSIPWAKSGIEETVAKGVEASRMILAVPFYTRLWAISTGADGSTEVTSDIVSVSSQDEILQAHGAASTYDADTGQNYAEYTADNAVYQIWLEDATSMESRLNLMSSYGLAGIASWREGLETEEIRTLINSYL